ncbi:hypothetical protein [Peptoniphilus indolicus]|nr:hypothetical protein [Peptoniphilus indolicus]
MIKKEKEGKAKKVCKFEGLNKLLRIYYAKVMQVKLGIERREAE